MKRIDLRSLLKQVEPHRIEVVEIDGVSMPKSAAMLLSRLATETEWTARMDLYGLAMCECGLADNTAAAVNLAQAYHQEFHDDVSLMRLSRALVENNELEAGLLRAREALESSIQNQGGVNDAAGNLVRLAVKTGSVETVNEAMEALVDSTDMPRKWDCVLDTDWCDKAEELGADMELISWVREAALAQLLHMMHKRRAKSRRAPESEAKA